MAFDAPHLRGSRNVIRLIFVVFAVALISWAQLAKVPDPWSDAEPASPPAGRPVAPTRAPAVPTRKPVNPGPFRLQIIQLEEVLYSPDAAYNEGWTVEVRGKSLADSLTAHVDDQDRVRAGIAVGRWAALIGGEMDAPYNRGPHWPEWRKQWEALRREYFLVADWYVRLDPNGVLYSIPPGPVSRDDRATVGRLNDLVGDLQTEIRVGLEQSMAISEPPGEVRRATAEGRAMEQQWRDWVKTWDRSVDSIAKPYGEAVAVAADQHIVLAGQDLHRALADLRLSKLVTPGLGYPSKQARRQRFDSVQAQVTRARVHLSKIGHPAEPVHD